MTLAWRVRSVLTPNEPFERAYSSLPTRKYVVSSRRTMVGQHLLPRQAGPRQVALRTRPGGAPMARPKSRRLSYLSWPCIACHRGGSGTACGPGRRDRSPAGGLRPTGRSTRPHRQAGSPANGCAEALLGPRSACPSRRRSERAPAPDALPAGEGVTDIDKPRDAESVHGALRRQGVRRPPDTGRAVRGSGRGCAGLLRIGARPGCARRAAGLSRAPSGSVAAPRLPRARIPRAWRGRRSR